MKEMYELLEAHGFYQIVDADGDLVLRKPKGDKRVEIYIEDKDHIFVGWFGEKHHKGCFACIREAQEFADKLLGIE